MQDSNNVSAYFSAIRAQKAKLDQIYPECEVYLYSIFNFQHQSVEGVVSHVTTRMAAESILKGVARIASASEVSEFHEKGKLFSAKMAADQVRRNPALGQTIILPNREAK